MEMLFILKKKMGTMNKLYTDSLSACFYIDKHKYNHVSKSLIKRLYNLYFSQRYSMPVYLRLTEFFFRKYKNKRIWIYKLLSDYFKRKNEKNNQFEHGYEHDIFPGTLFHHTGVTFPSGTKIGRNVQIFKNVTLALVDGNTCEIEDDCVIFSHVIILGRRIGANSVVGAGSVVTTDIPPNSVVAGVPAKVIKTGKNSSEYLEYK